MERPLSHARALAAEREWSRRVRQTRGIVYTGRPLGEWPIWVLKIGALLMVALTITRLLGY